MKEFLRACKERDRRRRGRRRRLGWLIGLGASAGLIVITAVLTFYVALGSIAAPLSHERCRAEGMSHLETRIDYALLAAVVAERYRRGATQPLSFPLLSDSRSLLFAALSASPQLETLLHLRPKGEVAQLAWDGSSQEVVVTSTGGSVQRFAVASGQRVPGALPAALPIRSASSSSADLLRLRLPVGTAFGAPARPVALSPDGKHLAVAGDDGSLQIWTVAPLQPLGGPWRGLHRPATGLAFSPDGRWLASGHGSVVAIWQVAPRLALGEELAGTTGESEGSPETVLPPAPEAVRALCPQGVRSSLALAPTALVAYGCAEGSLILTQGELAPRRLWGHQEAITHLDWSPEQGLLASGSSDGAIWLWNPALAVPAAGPFQAHRAPLRGLAFASGGTELLSASADGRQVRWDLDFEEWARRACRIANRNLATSELTGLLWTSSPDGQVPCPDLPRQDEEP